MQVLHIWEDGPHSVPQKMHHKHPRHGLCHLKSSSSFAGLICQV